MKERKFSRKKKRWLLPAVLAAVILCASAGTALWQRGNAYTPVSYPVYGFANMRGENGTVYKGIGGAYGEELPVKASTFTVRGEKLYYAGQIKEDYVVSKERTGTICESDLDGSHEKVLVEDAYNLGFGQEKLIGDKLFYPNGLDEDYNLTYAWYDVVTGEKDEIKSSRINNIFGFDGVWMYYGGYDAKKSRNIVGRYHLEKGKDQILFSYGAVNEEGDIISLYYWQEQIYAVTLMEEEKDYDARTAVYRMVVHNAKNGKVTAKLPLNFTGSANYGFLYHGGEVYFSTSEGIYSIVLPTMEERETGEEAMEPVKIAGLAGREYWGIPHFVPGDGYLYYEAIADIDELSGLNDYFYRVPLSGGEPELLAGWFTS